MDSDLSDLTLEQLFDTLHGITAGLAELGVAVFGLSPAIIKCLRLECPVADLEAAILQINQEVHRRCAGDPDRLEEARRVFLVCKQSREEAQREALRRTAESPLPEWERPPRSH